MKDQRAVVFLGAFLAALIHAGHVSANGVDGNGTGARSMGISGADVADPQDVLSIMGRNPAGLARVRGTEATFGLTAIYGDASFESRTHRRTGLTRNLGAFPELGIVASLPESRARLGFSIIPEQTRLGEWRYRDAPGGLDGRTSFGMRDHRSEISAIRSALGIAYPLTDRLSIGASLGVVYERIHLEAHHLSIAATFRF